MKWIRYRFCTRSIEDYRPLIFNPRYPWWCTSEADDFVSLVAYLPKGENLLRYWDDAFEVEESEEDKIRFTDRFPKPEYFVEK